MITDRDKTIIMLALCHLRDTLESEEELGPNEAVYRSTYGGGDVEWEEVEDILFRCQGGMLDGIGMENGEAEE